MRRRTRNILALGGICIVCGLLLSYVLLGRNVLARYGVEYKYLPTFSHSLNVIEFSLKTEHENRLGPVITVDDAVVRFQEPDREGNGEIIVRSGHTPSYAVIKVYIENGRAVRYHVVKSMTICISFPEEGYYCP